MIEINISKDNAVIARVYAGLENNKPTYWYENIEYRNHYCKKITALEFAEICAKNKQAQYRSKEFIEPNDLCYEQNYRNPTEYTKEDWNKQIED